MNNNNKMQKSKSKMQLKKYINKVENNNNLKKKLKRQKLQKK